MSFQYLWVDAFLQKLVLDGASYTTLAKYKKDRSLTKAQHYIKLHNN